MTWESHLPRTAVARQVTCGQAVGRVPHRAAGARASMSPPLRTGPDRVWRWQRFPRQRAGRFDSASSNSICSRASCARRACSSACRSNRSKCWSSCWSGPEISVTREQLRQRLWPNGTFVDFEHGLNAVINRLRETLGDSAESPRFIQTVPRRGYRFIAPVEGATGGCAHRGPASLTAVDSAPTGKRSTAQLQWRGWATAIAVSVLLVGAAATWLQRRTPPVKEPPPTSRAAHEAGRQRGMACIRSGRRTGGVRVVRREVRQHRHLRHAGRLDSSSAPDDGSGRRLRAELVARWATHCLPPSRSANAARIHVMSALGGPDQPVSDFPVGATEPVSLITVHITWSPDGRYVVAGRDPLAAAGDSAGLYLIPIDGGPARAITRPKPPTFHFSPVFSPDGRRMAYASCDTRGLDSTWLSPGYCSVASVDVDASVAPVGAARTLTSQPVDPAGMAWSRDGKSILFVGQGSSSVNLRRLWLDGTREPETVELAGGHAEHPAAATSRDRLVFSRYDWGMHLYRFAPGKPLERVAASSTSEGDPHFSPDGRRIAFASHRSGQARSGWPRPTDPIHVSSPHIDGDGRARPTGRRMAARSRSTRTIPMARPCLDHSRRRRRAAADHEGGGRSNRADLVSRREMDLLFGGA